MLTVKYLSDKTKLGISGEAADWRSIYGTVHDLMETAMTYDQEKGRATTLLAGFLEKIEGSSTGNDFSAQVFLKRDVLILDGLIKVIAPYTVLSQRDEVNLLLMDSFVAGLLGPGDGELGLEYRDFLKRLDAVKDIRLFTASFSGLSDQLFNSSHHYER